MDPDNIAAMTKKDVIQEDNIHPEEEKENDDRSNSEQEDEYEETNAEEEADEDLLQELQFNDNQQTRT